MKISTDRRGALVSSVGLAASGLARANVANAATEATLEPSGASNLHDLSQTLGGMPRRRDFKTRFLIVRTSGMRRRSTRCWPIRVDRNRRGTTRI